MSDEKQHQQQGEQAPVIDDDDQLPDGENQCEVVILEEEEDLGNEEEDEAHDDVSVHTFTLHTDAVYCVAFSKKPLANGALVFASGGGDDKAILYHLIDGEEPKPFILSGHKDSVNAIAFSADGSLLVTGGLDGLSIVWDSTDGHEVSRLEGPTDSVEWVGWHPSLPAVLVGDRSGMTWLFSAKIGKCVKVYSQHKGPVTCGSFRVNGSEIWTAGDDHKLRIWSPKTGQATTVMESIQFHHAPITCGCNNRNGAIIATGDVTGIIKIIQCDSAKVIGQLDTGEISVEKIEFSYDDKYIAVASMGGAATIWSPIDLKMRHALQHPQGVTSLAWHPKQPFLITSCIDGAVRVWDARNGQLISEMYGHDDIITGLDIIYDGQVLLIATSSEDTSVKLWVFDEANPIKPILPAPIPAADGAEPEPEAKPEAK